MKRLVALMICAVSLGAAAQITYPYNPDGNADSLIGVSDLQDVLSTFGLPFSPNEILVDSLPLDSVLSGMQSALDSLSETVSSQQEELDMIHYLDGVSNFDGDLVSTEYLTTSGSVAGGLNPTTITSGAPMDPIIVPEGKIYNLRYLYIAKSGANHKSAFYVDGYPLWGNYEAPGEVNFWLHEGQTLSMSYGGWNGQNGSYTDTFYVLIHSFDLPENSEVSTTTGAVGGGLNPTTINSGSPMAPITVPEGQLYNLRYLYIAKSGANHKSAYYVDGFPLWGNYEAPGEVNFWLHEGQTLSMSYGGWNGQNGSYNDSYYVLIHVFE